MKKVETISENKNFTAINVGSLDAIIVDYSFIHPKTQKEVTGKVFVKEATKATGSEISFYNNSPTEVEFTLLSYSQ